MDKKMLFAVAMAMLTFFLFKNYFTDNSVQEEPGVVAVGRGSDAVHPGQPVKIPSSQNLYKPLALNVDFDQKKHSPKEHSDVEIDTPLVHAVIASDGAVLTELSFKQHVGVGSTPLATINNKFLRDSSEYGCFLIALDRHTPRHYKMISKRDTGNVIEVVFKADSDYCSIKKAYTFHKDSYQIDLQITFEHGQKKYDHLRPRIFFAAPFIGEVDTEAPHLITWNESKRKLETIDYLNTQGRAWFWTRERALFGAGDRYFVHALVSDASEATENFVERAYVKQEYMVVLRSMSIDHDRAVDIVCNKMSIAPEEARALLVKLPALLAIKKDEADAHKLKNALEAAGIGSVYVDNHQMYPILEGPVLAESKSEWNLSFYMGPKVLEHVGAIDSRLEEVFAFGWFSWLCRALIKLLSMIYGYVGNFGLAIIVISIALKLPFMPFSMYVNKKMAHYQRYAPSINKIRGKYRQDLMLQQAEVMKFCKEHGTSPSTPMLGCLPILIQAPIIFALYRALSSYIDLYHAPFFGWIVDLSAKDPFYILPLLMGITMYWGQQLVPVRDEKQATLMLVLPIIMTVVMASFPAGLVLYWLMNNILTIVEHYLRVVLID